MDNSKAIIKLLFILYLLSCSGCKEIPKRDFFTQMKSQFGDYKTSSGGYFLKSLGIGNSAVDIDNVAYWPIKSDTGYFYLNGFIRKKDDKILFVPPKHSSTAGKEYTLFDFSSKIGQGWALTYNIEKSYAEGDTITYLGKKMDGIDSVHIFSITRFKKNSKVNKYLSLDHTLILNVNKIKGIKSITQKGITRPISYQVVFIRRKNL